jgi:hypothetical protein
MWFSVVDIFMLTLTSGVFTQPVDIAAIHMKGLNRLVNVIVDIPNGLRWLVFNT